MISNREYARTEEIIVLTDDQGYGDLSCHGNPVLKTPNLDQLWTESVRFTDFHVSPMCTPTRGQLMTGMDAMHNGATCVSHGRSAINRGIPTMADIFQANGYKTALFGKWHLGDNYPYRPQDRGFQEAIYHPSHGITSIPDYWTNDYFDDTYLHNGVHEVYKGYCTDVWFSETMKWIRHRQENHDPFFVYLPTNVVHTPWLVAGKWLKGEGFTMKKIPTEYGPVTLTGKLDDQGTLGVSYSAEYHWEPEKVVLHVPPLAEIRSVRVNGKRVNGNELVL